MSLVPGNARRPKLLGCSPPSPLRGRMPLHEHERSETFEARLATRSLIIATLGSLLVFWGYMNQQLMANLLPYLLFVIAAAWLPKGPPPTLTSTLVASSMSLAQASIYGTLGVDRWHEALAGASDEQQTFLSVGCRASSPYVRLIRGGISFVWAAGFLLLAIHVLCTRCQGFWTALRLVIGLCSGVRFGGNVLVYAIGAPDNCFVPGNATLSFALGFNLGCIVFVLVVLSSRCRYALSEWTGGALVVLSLSEVKDSIKDEASDVGFSDLDSMSSRTSSYRGGRLDSRGHHSHHQTASSKGSSAISELGRLWEEAPADPADERMGSAVFYDSDDSNFDRRSPTRELLLGTQSIQTRLTDPVLCRPSAATSKSD